MNADSSMRFIGKESGDTNVLGGQDAGASSTQLVNPDDLIKPINSYHDRAIGYASQAVEYAREAGKALLEAKEQVPHGQWSQWCSDNLTFAERTAQRYMQLYQEWDKLENRHGVADLTVNQAVRLLAGPKRKENTTRPKPSKSSTPEQVVKQFEAACIGIKDACDDHSLTDREVRELAKRLLSTLKRLLPRLSDSDIHSFSELLDPDKGARPGETDCDQSKPDATIEMGGGCYGQ